MLLVKILRAPLRAATSGLMYCTQYCCMLFESFFRMAVSSVPGCYGKLCWGVQYREVVVSVARKTDASMWPALFAAAGDPGELLKGLAHQGALQSAACSLLIVDRLQGPDMAQSLALQLLQACSPRLVTFPVPLESSYLTLFCLVLSFLSPKLSPFAPEACPRLVSFVEDLVWALQCTPWVMQGSMSSYHRRALTWPRAWPCSSCRCCTA